MKTLPPGCFGKLPLHGDFIASARGSVEIAELDRWLQEGMAAASQKLAGGWSAAFDAAPTARFLFRSPSSGRLLAGVWRHSRDRVGRQFPIFVFVLGTEAIAGSQLRATVAGLAGFFAATEELLARDWRTGDVASFLAAVAKLPVDGVAAEPVVTPTSGEFLAAIGGPAGAARRLALVSNLIELSRGDVPRLLLRFPLSEPRSETPVWLDYLGRLAGPQPPTLTIWADGPARSLQSWFPAPAARMFLPAFLPDRTDATVFDLVGPAAAPTGTQERARLERLAADPGMPMDQWLDELRALMKRPSRGEA